MSQHGATWAAIGRAALTTTVLAAGAAVSFGKKALEVGAEFDSSMSQVAATMGLTQEEIEATGGAFEKLRDAAKKYGAETAFTATQCAEALNYMALAGYDADTSVSMLPNVLNLAAAGTMELARASDMITDSQTALGLSLDETRVLVDQMAKASSKSNTSVEQLGDAILTIGGTARYIKGGTTELNTILGILADNGIKGSEAGTHLRNMLLSLANPSNQAKEAIQKLGIDIFDAEGQLRSFNELWPELSAAMADFTDEEKLQTFGALFNTRDIASANALLGTSIERWEELGVAIEDSTGAAELMAATQLDNLAGDVTIFKSALDGVYQTISDSLSPLLREFVQFGTDGLSRLTAAFNEGGLKSALAALGSVLSDALAQIINYMPRIMEAGIGLLGALAEGILNNLPEMLTAALEAVLALARGIINALPELLPAIIEIIFAIVDTLIDHLDELIDVAADLIIAIAEGLIKALPVLIEKAPEIIIKLAKALIDMCSRGGVLDEVGNDIIKSIVKALVDNVPKLLEAGRGVLQSLWEAFCIFLGIGSNSRFYQIGSNIIDGIFAGLSAGWSWLTNQVSNLATNLLNSAKWALGIFSPSTKFKNEVSGNIVKGLVAGLDDYGDDAVDATERVTQEMLSAADVSIRAGVDTSGLYSVLDSVAGLDASVAATHAPIVIHNNLNGSIDVDGFRLGKIMLSNLDDAAAYALPD